jgi:hypothetical protein
MTYRGIMTGYLLGVFTIVGCASTGVFPWRYYGTQMDAECYDNGTLLGKAGKYGWPDKSLDECKPDPSPSPGASTKPTLLKCITLDVNDFYSLKADYLQCQSDLNNCQQGHKK